MIILGINAYHGDSSACIVVDGKLIAAVEEERFRRIKHWAGFPSEAIRYCLREAKVKIKDIDHIAVNRNPNANLFKKILFALSKRPSFAMVKDRLSNAAKVRDIRAIMCDVLGVMSEQIKAKIHHVEHHKAHLASSFFVSPYEEATLLSVDGFGDFVSTMTGIGKGSRIDVFSQVNFPHSLGLFYLAITQFLGFPKYGDEYKVMGLSALGRPVYLDKMRKIVKLGTKKTKMLFKLNLDYFIHHSKGITMTWNDGEPKIGSTYSEKMIKEFGPPRKWDDPITEHHKNIASSLQAMYEEVFFHILNTLYKKTMNSTLCLSGGCAMNSVANGKIFDNTPFKDIYIQSAAGDAGGAIGAAFYIYHQIFGNKRNFVMDSSYWGPQFSETEISKEIESRSRELESCIIEKIESEDELCKRIAKEIENGKVIGWFQGRTEWGPRALGNRSIIVDPRRHEMKDILNSRIKRRESFRPFAPSILSDAVDEYFEKNYPDPFMLKVYPIKKEKRDIIPAVTHIDGTGRLQTVRKQDNPLYWKLIKEFERLTGVPVVLNTSFNENEPIVNTPKEATDCFLRTRMDILVLGNYIISRKD
jgi:carbamoyltransferase